MDFASISGRSSKSSVKRKQSSSLLTAFRKSSAPPPSAYNPPPPPSSTSTHFPEPESPYAESVSSQSHSNTFYPFSDFNPSSLSRYAESTTSTSLSSKTALTAVPGTARSESFHAQYGRGGAGRVRSTSGAVSVTSGAGSEGKRADKEGGGEKVKDKDRDRQREKSGEAIVRRPEDMVKVVKDRLFSWSYMMQWYQGDTHWFNTVKIPRTATESYLGPKHLESRARNYFILGISLGLLFDIASAGDYLRAVNRVLEEWEQMVEGGGKVRGLFKGQKGNRKSGGSAGEYMGTQDGDSALLQVNLPFTLDFFQIHSTTCSLIRDVYKKTLRLFLPARPPTSSWAVPVSDPNALLHASTVIHSAPLEAPLPSRSNSADQGQGQQHIHSPSTRSVSSNSHSMHQSYTSGLSPRTASHGTGTDDIALGIGQAFAQTPGPSAESARQADQAGLAGPPGESEYDAFQAYITGELGSDRTLVGEGQALTKDVVDLFTKVDARLRKQLALLLRETDLLARRVLDEELTTLMASLDPNSRPLAFDYTAALSNTGNGFSVSGSGGGSSSGAQGSRYHAGPGPGMGAGDDARSVSGRSGKSGTRSISSGSRIPRASATASAGSTAPPPPLVSASASAGRRDDTEYLYSEPGGSYTSGPSPRPSPSPSSLPADPMSIPLKARAGLGIPTPAPAPPSAIDMDPGRTFEQPRGVPMGLPEGFDDTVVGPDTAGSGSGQGQRRGLGVGVPLSVSEEGHELR